MIKIKDLEVYHVENPRPKADVEAPFSLTKSNNRPDGSMHVNVYIEKSGSPPDKFEIELNSFEPYFYVGKQTFTSDEKIQKSFTMIHVEVKDERGTPILTTRGTVNNFISKPKRCTNALDESKEYYVVSKKPNCIVVDVLWQDERQETESKPLNFDDILENGCDEEETNQGSVQNEGKVYRGLLGKPIFPNNQATRSQGKRSEEEIRILRQQILRQMDKEVQSEMERNKHQAQNH